MSYIMSKTTNQKASHRAQLESLLVEIFKAATPEAQHEMQREAAAILLPQLNRPGSGHHD